jgi:hypothetical protein
MPDVQTAPPVAKTPKGGKTLPPAQVDVWRRRITAALEGTKAAIEQGKTNVARYTGKYLTAMPAEDECLVPTDFYFVESKKAQLFYRLPDVFLKPQQPGLDDAAIVFQAALNEKLGPQGVNVLPTVQQVIFDLLCPTGFGAVAIGFQTEIDGTQEVPLGPPMVDPLSGMEIPAPTETIPNIVATWFFIEHIKPGDLLVPPEFVGLDFDKSPWIGQRFHEDVPDSTEGGDSGADERRLTPLPSGAQAALRKQRTGYEVWYRAHLFDADVKHPDKIRTFKVYDDDKEAPVTVRDHPHQRYATPAGKLLKGMQGYPISPVTLRYVSDTWMAPSDATMARNTADELSKGRTQMLRSRDRNMPQWGYDSTRVDKDIQGKIERNEIQGGIPFTGSGQDATWPIQKGNAPKETYTFNDIAQSDLQRIWRMGSNQIGVLDDKGSRTATEQQITQNASQEAHEADRSVILNWYVQKVVAKFASLLQLYATEQEFVELVGADAQRVKSVPPELAQQAKAAGQDARVLVPWTLDTIAGPFTFSAKPNSQLFIDAAQEKKQLMDLYNFFANEPTVNRAELTRAILARYGFDPSKMMQPPPPKQSAPPAVALSVKGDDFNPNMPQSPILLDALSKLGVPIDLQAVAAAQAVAAMVPPEPGPDGEHGAQPQTEHGGSAVQAEPMSKHPAELTGGMQGSGSPAPLGAGGHL